jgi:MinD superfamily P-loop ATPase
MVEQMARVPLLDEARCTACGDCVSVCAPGVLALVDGRLEFVRLDSCDYCGECEAICADAAISCPYDIIEQRDDRSPSSRV